MKTYNLYSYINYYGFRKFAIAANDVMPRNYEEIIATSSDIKELTNLCDIQNKLENILDNFKQYTK